MKKLTTQEEIFWKLVDSFGIRVLKQRNKFIKKWHLEAYKIKKDYKKRLTAKLLICCIGRSVGNFFQNSNQKN